MTAVQSVHHSPILLTVHRLERGFLIMTQKSQDASRHEA